MATQTIAATAAAIPLSEDGLIRAGQRGDHEAMETLFRRYQRPLFQTALRVLGNAEDAEDALQDGLLSAFRNLKRFEGRSQFSTWLTRIVINAALMRRRSAKARRRSGLPMMAPTPSRSSRARSCAKSSAKIWTNFRLCCAWRSCCAKCKAIPRAKPRRSSALRKIR